MNQRKSPYRSVVAKTPILQPQILQPHLAQAGGGSKVNASFSLHNLHEGTSDNASEQGGGGQSIEQMDAALHPPPVQQAPRQGDDLDDVRQLLLAKQTILCELIGSGNYAQVYKGMNQKTKKVVAIKVISLTKANSNYRSHFLPQELAIIKKLKHPRIVKLFTISQVGNKIVLVMEFAANGTMSDWVANHGAFVEKYAWSKFFYVKNVRFNRIHCL